MTVIDLPDLDAPDTDTHPAATPEQNELLAWAKRHDTRRPGPPVRNGRYRAPRPGDTKERSWTRVSTIAALLDDPKSLEKWRRRILMRGLHDSDSTLADLAATAVRDGDDTELNRIAELALGRGGVTVAADLGTAIHTACEHIDEHRLSALTDFPDRYRPDLAAYRTLLDRYGLEPVAVETPCFTPLDPNDPTEAAVGRIDRIYRTRRGKLIVGDIKTGSSVEWLNNAIQAAIYTRATHHWGPDGWTEAPPVEQDAAFIVHLPLGEGTAELIRIDTASAWERIDAALAVRRARRGVNLLFTPAPPPPPETPAEAPSETPVTKPDTEPAGEQKVTDIPFPTEPPTDRDEWITGRIKTLTASTAARQLLQEQWPDNTPRRPPWTPAQHELIVPVLDDIETRVRAPFPHNDPEAAPKPLSGHAKALLDPDPPPPNAPDWPTPDNGTDIPDAEMQPIHNHYRGLPDHVRALVARWADQGRDTNRHWGRDHRGDPWTQRATALTLAAIACATHLWDDDEPDVLTRTAIGLVTGQPLEPTWLTGAVIGALTTTQATNLEDLATRYGNGDQQALTIIGEAITRT